MDEIVTPTKITTRQRFLINHNPPLQTYLMHIVHQSYEQSNNFYMLPRGLKRCPFICTAVCTVNKSNQLDSLFFQAFADSVFILFAEILRKTKHLEQ